MNLHPGLLEVVSFDNPQPLGGPGWPLRRSQRVWAGQLATEHVELAIGMDATVGDRIAQTFAGQFYNSLGFGLSVAQAFAQAVLQVELEHGEGHEIPKLFQAESVDPATVVLVNPENQPESV